MMRSGLRHFYIAVPLRAGGVAAIPKELQHRLSKVLRLAQGSRVAVFNGEDGLFEATLADAKCRQMAIGKQLQAQPNFSRKHVYVGIPKREAWESILRQVTELGVTDIHPLLTSHAVPTRINAERAQALIVEAAEQCERLTLPTLHPLITLEACLSKLTHPVAWAHPAAEGASTEGVKQVDGVVVGPEGGFALAEEQQMLNHPHIHAVQIAGTILRTDTAVVAAVAKLLT